jgi:hypothetical protein
MVNACSSRAPQTVQLTIILELHKASHFRPKEET